MINKALAQCSPTAVMYVKPPHTQPAQLRPARRPRLKRFPLLESALITHLVKTLPLAFVYADTQMSVIASNDLFAGVCFANKKLTDGSCLCEIIEDSIWQKFESAYRRALCGSTTCDVHLGAATTNNGEERSLRTFSFYPVSDEGKVVGVGVAVASCAAESRTLYSDTPNHLPYYPSTERSFLAEMMSALTEGKLVLCSNETDLPVKLSPVCPPIPLAPDVLGIVRRHVREAATCLKFDDLRTADFVLGVGEALDNVLVHAGKGNAEVLIDRSNHVIQVRVSDVGHGIDEQIIHRAALERGYTTAGTLGHGFFLILNTCDRVWLMTSPLGTTVVLEQDRLAA